MTTRNIENQTTDKTIIYRQIATSITDSNSRPTIENLKPFKRSILEKKLHIHKIRTLNDPTIFMDTLLSPDLQIQKLTLELSKLLIRSLEQLSTSHILETYFTKFSFYSKAKFLYKISRLSSLSECKADELFDIFYEKYNTTYIYTIFHMCSFNKLTENIDLLLKFPIYKRLVLQKIYKKRPQFFTHLVFFLEQRNLVSENTLKSILPYKLNKNTFKANTSILFTSFNNKPLISLYYEDQFSKLALKELFKKHKEKLQQQIDHFLNFSLKYYIEYSFPEEMIYKVLDHQIATSIYDSFSCIMHDIRVHTEEEVTCFSRYLESRKNSMGFKKLDYEEIFRFFNHKNKYLFMKLAELDLIDKKDKDVLTPPEEFVKNKLKNSTASMFLNDYTLIDKLMASCLLYCPDPFDTFISIIYNNFMEEKETKIMETIYKAIYMFRYSSKRRNRSTNRRLKRNKISHFEKNRFIINLKDNTLMMLDEITKMFRFKSHFLDDYEREKWNPFVIFKKFIFQLFCYCKRNKISDEIYSNMICIYSIDNQAKYSKGEYYIKEKNKLHKTLLEDELLSFKKRLDDTSPSNSRYVVENVIPLIHSIIKLNEKSGIVSKIEIPQCLIELVKNKAEPTYSTCYSELKEIEKVLNFELPIDKRFVQLIKGLFRYTKLFKYKYEQEKDIMVEILNKNFDLIVHFKNTGTKNFIKLPKVIKKLILENLEHPIVKEVHEEFVSLIKNYDESKILSDPCLSKKLLAAIDFLSYTNSFPLVIEKIFSRTSNNDKKVPKWSKITSLKKSVLISSRNYQNPEQIVLIIKKSYPKELEIESLTTIKNMIEKLEPNKFEQLAKELLKEHNYNLLFIRSFHIHNPKAALTFLKKLTKSSLTNQQTMNIITYLSSYLKANEDFEIFDLMVEMINSLDYNLFKLNTKIKKIDLLSETLKRKLLNVLISKALESTDDITASCCYELLEENYDYLDSAQKIAFLKQEILSEQKMHSTFDRFSDYKSPPILTTCLESLKEVESMKEFVVDFISTIRNIYSDITMNYEYVNMLASKIKEIVIFVNKNLLMTDRKGISNKDKVEVIEISIKEWDKQIPCFVNTEDFIFELRLYEIMLLNYNEGNLNALVLSLEELYISYKKCVKRRQFSSLAEEVFIMFHFKNKTIRQKLIRYLEQQLDTKDSLNAEFLCFIIEVYYCFKLYSIDIKKECAGTELFDKTLKKMMIFNENSTTKIEIGNYIGL